MNKKFNLMNVGTAVVFGNGVCVVNTTPHPIRMQDVDGTLVEVPTTVLINAKPVEEAVDELLVTTRFVGTPEGAETIQAIQDAFKDADLDARLIIVGSIIAAQAFPGQVMGLCPVPGYERVAPSEKRMRCDKFTTFTN